MTARGSLDPRGRRRHRQRLQAVLATVLLRQLGVQDQSPGLIRHDGSCEGSERDVVLAEDEAADRERRG